jgi:hypothetical protein
MQSPLEQFRPLASNFLNASSDFFTYSGFNVYTRDTACDTTCKITSYHLKLGPTPAILSGESVLQMTQWSVVGKQCFPKPFCLK